ncbi:hypothetical protein MGWOODY_Mmi1156 [hydrothermal vent metagenome]|uniref:Uncharacterized protein n=1 Tax=hydrothermal vent metagenome TaxID=652676 RepID=A0A160VFU9_9ZZZZ
MHILQGLMNNMINSKIGVKCIRQFRQIINGVIEQVFL